MEWSISEFFGKALFAAAVLFLIVNFLAIPMWCLVSSWTYWFCLKKAAMVWLAIAGMGACVVGLKALADTGNW